MIDPVTATLIATAVATAAKGAGDYFSGQKQKKIGKMRAKETKRETLAGLMNDAMQGSAELHTQGLKSRSHLGKRRAQSSQDTADIVRGALNI